MVEDKIRTKNKSNKQKMVTNIVDLNPNISTITLTISGLNVPIKRQIQSGWIKKQEPTIYCQ